MNTSMNFTPRDIITIILAVSTGIVTFSSGLTVIINWINKARQPEFKQNERITVLERKVEMHDKILEKYEKFL